MNQSSPNEDQIFRIARVIPSAIERSEYLKQVCGENSQLFERMVALLKTTDEENSFLESPPEALAATRDVSPAIIEKPGTEIGPYKLLQQIGEGGFGVVYMAEQLRPVKRKVALKIIKPGMDSKEVIARFEAERQALALMDHPNIAKVFDGGTTDSGRPYFVMELVKGVALTEFCDKNRLTTEQRLKLFAKVCQAIQHAHQKGVIHRDIKPSNVMVTLNDNQPIPKVIDFGVAKAISQELTEKTLFTTYGQMIGTPQYMSPEQAQMSGLDIDTRSDVYSLGVLLYELLTGKTPLDVKQLRNTAYAEMQRLICEVEPSKPSTKVSGLGEASMTIAQNRGIDARKLNLLLRGDLDWIVMTALDKDRNRRYESAGNFAADIERYLADEPIQARPPSTVYKIRKFVRRHRAKVYGWTGAMLLSVVALFAIGIAINNQKAAGALIAERQKRAIDDARSAFLRMDFEALRNSIKIADSAGASGVWMEILKGRLALSDGDRQRAIEHFENAIIIDEKGVAPRANLAIAYGDLHQPDQRDRLYELEKYDAETSDDFLFKGEAYLQQGYFFLDKAKTALDEAIDRHESYYAHVTRAKIRANQARFITGDLLDYEKAFDDMQAAEAFATDKVAFARHQFQVLVPAAFFYREKGDVDKSNVLYREALELTKMYNSLDFGPIHFQFLMFNASLEEKRQVLESMQKTIDKDWASTCFAALFSIQFGDQETRESLKKLNALSVENPPLSVYDGIEFLEIVLDNKQRALERLHGTLSNLLGGFIGERMNMINVANLAGDHAFVRKQCDQLTKELEKSLGTAAVNHRLNERKLGIRVLTGELNYQDVLDLTKDDRTQRMGCLTGLAFLRLSQGEKVEAQKILKEVVAMDCYMLFYPYQQANAILYKLENDSDWYDNYIDDIKISR